MRERGGVITKAPKPYCLSTLTPTLAVAVLLSLSLSLLSLPHQASVCGLHCVLGNWWSAGHAGGFVVHWVAVGFGVWHGCGVTQLVVVVRVAALFLLVSNHPTMALKVVMKLYTHLCVVLSVFPHSPLQVRFIGSNHITSHELLSFNMVWLGLQVRTE